QALGGDRGQQARALDRHPESQRACAMDSTRRAPAQCVDGTQIVSETREAIVRTYGQRMRRGKLPVVLKERSAPNVAAFDRPSDMERSLSGLIDRLRSENEALRKENARLHVYEQLAYHDDLTGIHNRRYFEQRI